MTARTFVTFKAGFPDDAQFTDTGSPLVPGGRELSEALRAHLSEAGFACSQVRQHSFYGWSFEATKAGLPIWLLVQGGGPWLLICEPRPSFLRRLIGMVDGAALRDCLSSINEILHGDQQFCEPRWYTKRDYESQNESAASDTPFD